MQKKMSFQTCVTSKDPGQLAKLYNLIGSFAIHGYICPPQWLIWMHVRLIIGKLLVQPLRGRQHSFVEIDHEIFTTVILSLVLIQEGQCRFLAKECTRYWLTNKRTRPAQ